MSEFFSGKTVLLPFDFSDAATAAVKTAMEMTEGQSQVHVLHILVPMHLIAVEPGVIVDMGNDLERMQGAKESMRKRFGELGDQIQFEARIGDPGSEIVEYGKEIGAELIVMSSHGRSGLKRMLLGSVAERVIRLAECPVMVVRRPHTP